MIVNFTLNDSTQKDILQHLETTSHLLSKVATKLSGQPRESVIYAMPDLGIAQNGTRMLGGFYTGACYTWESDVPFVPVDATVNVCGTAVFRLQQKITTEEFKQRLDAVMQNRDTYLEYAHNYLPAEILNSIDVNDASKFYWNYNSGNHFVMLVEQEREDMELPAGQYMVVHASAIELKKDNMLLGLYPVEGNWFYNDIQTEYDENSQRYLRYIIGDKAVRFAQLAHSLQEINKERNRFFCQKVLGELIGDEIINLSHYGMPTSNAICIGCQWENTDFTLLTAPGNDVFLVHPKVGLRNTISKQIMLTPHGCGVRLNNDSDKIFYRDGGIEIGGKFFQKGQSINIGNDVSIRTLGMSAKEVENHVEQVLSICPGKIFGQLKQLFARTKHGDFDYMNR